MNFNRGDVIECLKDYGTQFTRGKHYVVLDVLGDMVHMIDDRGLANGWTTPNFILVRKSPSYPGLPQGQPMGNSPMHSGFGALVPVLPSGLSGLSAWLPNGIDLGKPIFDEAHVEQKKCECGCSSVGVSNHSDYCPLYER